MFEPTEAMKAAYEWARLPPENSLSQSLADLALHATATALEAEHELFHSKQSFCAGGECAYDPADWLKLADEKLREVKR